MHPTRDTLHVMNSIGAGGRVMPAFGGGVAKGSGAPRSPGGGRRITAGAGSSGGWTPPNNGMHPTADTNDFNFLQRVRAAGDAWR